jgi:hypothetical protein
MSHNLSNSFKTVKSHSCLQQINSIVQQTTENGQLIPHYLARQVRKIVQKDYFILIVDS